jgi:2-polyprenyl-3-methyl-5-hydroxy-6-metoxy-1,4-benzoquinol methylase
MREEGWQVFGIEISEYAGTFARNTLGLNIYTGSMESFDCSWTDFDVVTFYHTLEHVCDPQLALYKAYDVLKPGGMLVIEVPNIDNLLFNVCRFLGVTNMLYQTLSQETNWAQYPHFLLDVPRHLYFFSPHTLSQMLIKAHMEILKCEQGYIGTNGVIDTAIYIEKDLWQTWKDKNDKRLSVNNSESMPKLSIPFCNEPFKSLILLISRLILECFKPLRKGDHFTIYARKPH